MAKLTAEGYSDNWEDGVARLTAEELEKEIGIESRSIRNKLLQAFATVGPCKTIKYIDYGVEVEVAFRPPQFAQFLKELWSLDNDLERLRTDGTWSPVMAWYDLKEGYTYVINHWR